MSEKLMCEEQCEMCGHPWDEKHHRLRICTNTGKLVCEWCHTRCQHYRKNILPNGTHCVVIFEKEYNKYRLLYRPILAPESEVNKAVPKYENEPSGVLFDKFYLEAHLYGNVDEPQIRAAKRVELAAMQKVLRPKILADPLTRKMYYRFNGIKEDDNERTG